MAFLSRRHEPPAMTLEGTLGPNEDLERAAGVAVADPDALCVSGSGSLLVSSGSRVLSISAWGERPEVWAEFDRRVTALAVSPRGAVAVGLSGGSLVVRDPGGLPDMAWPALADVVEVKDCVFTSDDEILVVDSGVRDDDDFLSRATWDDEGRGSIASLTRAGTAPRRVAGGLRCPMGICLDAASRPVISLFERASLVDIAGQALQAGYPAYLGRVRRTAGGYALACLSRRDPLIGFLREEREFVAEMKKTLAPRHWIAPRRSPAATYEVPIELGATRLFGEIKPWAPSFSYGLVIETDDAFMPVASAHSRADGRRHAISDVTVWNGNLVAISRASGEILNLGREANA